jgi:TIR domain
MGAPRHGYTAFISYKHASSTAFAARLEGALKGYAKPFSAPPIRIFRDEKHIAPGVDLPQMIVDALDASSFLILLASPEAAHSQWVHDEVDHWCGKLDRTQNLIIILLRGEIGIDGETKRIDWARTNALPTTLMNYFEKVPFYLDLRETVTLNDPTVADPDFKRAVNGITARFRGLDPNDMLGEEILQHRRNMRLRNVAIGALAALTIVSLITALQMQIADRESRIALSRQYAAEATSLLEHNLDDALLLSAKAFAAFRSTEAHNVIFEALSHNPAIRAFLYESTTDEPVVFAIGSDGRRAVLAAGDKIRVLRLNTDVVSLEKEIQPGIGTVASLAFSQSGALLAVGGRDGRISILRTFAKITAPISD